MNARALLLMLLLYHLPAHAGDRVFSSGERQNMLLELYTSEGCSSCPPLERYLNDFKSDKELWTSWVPVAFHVDYWDHLGWKDRFASPDYGVRQGEHAREGNLRSVYTPALLANGRGWRPAHIAQRPRLPRSLVGNLEVRVERDLLTAEYLPTHAEAAVLDLHIAVLGMGLSSEITAGENQGRAARHEFVVLGYKKVPGQKRRWQTRVPEPRRGDARADALAVWLTRAGSLAPVQAVGGYLDPSVPTGSVTASDDNRF